MTDKLPPAGEKSSDLAALAADTLLLDGLGRGDPAPADDRVGSLLAAWRADLAGAESDPVADLETARLVADLEMARLVAAEAGDAGRDRAHRVARWALGAAAAVLIAGGLIVGAGHATPGSPLWPITRVMYPQHADNAAAEHSVALARRAAAEGRGDDARRLLAQAETLIARLPDRDRAQRLRAELRTVEGMLPAAPPNTSAPVTTPGVPSTAPTGGPAVTPPAGVPVPLPTGAVPVPKLTGGAAPALPPAVPLPPPAVSVPTVTLGPGIPPLPTLAPRLGTVPPVGGRLLPGAG